jgi:hypothetical protein
LFPLSDLPEPELSEPEVLVLAVLSEVPAFVLVLAVLSEVPAFVLLVLAVLSEVPVFELPALEVSEREVPVFELPALEVSEREVPALVLAVPALEVRDCFHSIPVSSAAATFRQPGSALGFWELSGPVLRPGLALGIWEPVLGPDSASGFSELQAAVLRPVAGRNLLVPWGRKRKVRLAPPLWPVQS